MTSVPIPSPAGALSGYLATPPTGQGPWPGVVVLHEAFGLTDDIRRICDRIAAEGYVALAPDLFSWASTPRCLVATFRSLFRERGRAFDDVDAARRLLLERDDTTERTGVVGFCMGGSYALLASVRGFDVSAPSYAHLPKDPERTLAAACPVVASYGRLDLSLRGAAEKLDRALTANGVEHDVVEYPGVGHSFLNRYDSGPLQVLDRLKPLAHDADVAEDAWRRIFAAFETHLRGSRHR